MSSSKVDPRRVESVVPFHLPPRNEEEEDWTGMLATFVSMGGMMSRNRYKMIPWVAAYFGLTAFLNGRKTLKPKDSIGNSGSLLAIVTLFTFYLNMYLAHKKSLEAFAAGQIIVSDEI